MLLNITHKTITKVNSEGSENTEDLVAVEEPMEIQLVFYQYGVVTEKQVSITMRTPGNDFELAAGFLFSEGVISQPQDILSIAYCRKALADGNKNVVKVLLKEHSVVDLKTINRHFYINGSCGVCGKSSIEALSVKSSYSIDYDLKINKQILLLLMPQMQHMQVTFKHTGGIHACALFDKEGNIILVKEDVGRHNALDKLIGAYVNRNELPLKGHILLLSGRISFELVQKSTMAGIPIIAGAGAPSSLAIETAKEAGITLIGFLKENSLNIYTHPQRISLD